MTHFVSILWTKGPFGWLDTEPSQERVRETDLKTEHSTSNYVWKKNKTYLDDRSLKIQSTWVTSTQRDDGSKLIETRLVHIAPKLRKGQEANTDQKIFSITTLAETTPGFFFQSETT